MLTAVEPAPSGLSGPPGWNDTLASLTRAGRALLEAGRVEEARQALEVGVLLEDGSFGEGDSGKPSARALSSRISYRGEARFGLANLLHAEGRYDEAAVHYGVLIDRVPAHTEAHFNLGVTELLRGRVGEAAAAYRRTLDLNPHHLNAHNNLAMLLESFGTGEESRAEALGHFRAAGTVEAQYNLALLLQERGETNQAVDLYQALLDADPANHEVRNNLANIAMAAGRVRHALGEYRHILTTVPDFADAHRNVAMSELMLGNFEEGFREYEWRLRQEAGRERNWRAPLWDGTPIAGRTILLHAEQGLGDTIQFVRFVPDVVAFGADVIVETQPPAVDLVKSMRGVGGVVARGAALPDHDLQYPLMSLPFRLGVTLETLPAAVPYLSAGRARVAAWRKKIDAIAATSELRVGLAWSGNPQYKDNAKRSVPPELLAALAGVDGVSWFGLQKDQAGVRIPGLAIEWLEGPGTVLLDAAAIITNLDLVISVDTSIAHLAGALGRPVWLLAAHAPDWRWMRERDDSPWYPTMRLFRQSRAQEWVPVLERVRTRLAALVRESA